MDGNCNAENVIYQAEVTTSTTKETYIGLCDTTFKLRYRNHMCSFRNERDKHDMYIGTLPGLVLVLVRPPESWSLKLFFSGASRKRSTIAKKILVTHRCEKIWFYSQDLIDRPYIRPSVRTSVHPSAPSFKSNVKRRTVTG